jgi:hypothetical protein
VALIALSSASSKCSKPRGQGAKNERVVMYIPVKLLLKSTDCFLEVKKIKAVKTVEVFKIVKAFKTGRA